MRSNDPQLAIGIAMMFSAFMLGLVIGVGVMLL
jgi:hypothetical protein